MLSKRGETAIFKRLAVFPLIKLIELHMSINADNSVSAIEATRLARAKHSGVLWKHKGKN